MAEIDPATGVAATGGLLGAVTLLWQIVQKFKSDTRNNSRETAKDDFRDTLLKENTQLRKRCDAFAHERNAALVKIARLEGDREVLLNHLLELGAKPRIDLETA